MPLKLMSAIINTSQASQACSEKDEAENLLTTLLFYVKQCQARFGGKTELATEFDNNVAGLCGALEAVLSHGLRSRPQDVVQGSALKQVSDIVSNSLSFNNETSTYWHFVKHHLTKHEQERYAVLRQIWTDVGRGKAWIRSALNERSLERYFHCLLSNAELLNRYYEDWALLCDQEKSAMLPNMAAGLGPILFAISIDKPELNTGDCSLSKLKNQSEPIIISEPNTQKGELKKKKRVPAQIISFDDDEEDNNSCLSYTSGSSVSQDKNIPSQSENPKTGDKDTSVLPQKPKKNYIAECFPNLSKNLSPTEKTQDNQSTAGSSTCNSNVEVTLTPVQHADIGELIPVETEIDQFSSESPGSNDDNIEMPSDIVAVLTTVENKNKEEQNNLLDKITALTNENEKLKTRLKKYISAVQMLKTDDGSAHKTLADLSFSEDSGSEEIDHLVEAKVYENKLVQVAEMHGELMEFNDYLQKMLGQKESLLQRLRSELAELRGPLPSDKLSLNEETFETVGLVSICVPSAFLTGSGSEAHHVYQIYIRAGNDDWNIYRRYAQFYSLQKELRKLDPAVANFDFPPKKSLGNKDANLVEDRRRRLQTYLRRILAHWPELGNCNSRYLLERHLSFFRDQPTQDTKNKNSSRKGVFSSKKNTTPTNNENHYTGL